jgi:hypothetical protein
MAAVEGVVGSWLDAGALGDARTALDRLRATTEGMTMSRLGVASLALLGSRLSLAEGDTAAAASEADRVLETRSPWWRARGLRALVASGAAGDEALAEAVTLERALGIDHST